MDEQKILQFIAENGMINLDDVQSKMESEEKEKVLNEHHYDIWQASDGRWKTYLHDDTKKSKRRLIAKSTREKIIDEIYEFHQNSKGIINVGRNVTLREIYPLWLQSRKLEVTSVMTIKKNDQDWRRYYLSDDIIDIPLKNLSAQQLKDWCHKKIDDCQLNKKQYYNMAIVFKQCFWYACDIGAIPENTWERVKINTKKLKREVKKESEVSVYFDDEKKKIINYSFQIFFKNRKNITALAIPFMFLTGVRIGELVALKYSDITANGISINKEETIQYNVNSKGEFKYTSVEVQHHAKSEAGVRMIPVTNELLKIVMLIKKASEDFRYKDDDYIFCPHSKRICAVTIDHKLYNYCDKLNIPRKSAHKIRKTYISKLINCGEVDIDTICKVVGHVDMNTTFKSYCFSLDKKSDICEKFEDILSIGHV